MGVLDFPQVDQTATAKRVREFLDKDFMLCVRRLNRRPQDLKSPVFDTQPKGAPTGNGNEQKIIEYLYMKEVYQAVGVAIGNCSRRANEILVGCYLDELPDNVMQERLGFSHAHYNTLKQRALNELADRLWAQIGKDLHVYCKSPENQTLTSESTDSDKTSDMLR